ncbi:hypothetical protein ACQPZF_39950 [Actinosynnema sp. CS-041913]|uniref:hypothetical protein n=1 Tax=Actinosynnema sp. CS-041913 TaxID=3239917 RepID=UPI003D8E35AB
MELDPAHFVVFGSAPLFVHGLRADVPDLDVLARGSAWEEVVRSGTPAVGEHTGDIVWQFCGGRIQFSERWISDDFDTDTLIAEADVFRGLRFARLSEVLRYKEEMHRPKDHEDITALRERLGDRIPALAG